MCKIWTKKDIHELPANEYRKIKKMDVVNISGGEPFLREDIVDIVGYLTESQNKQIVICTNGLVSGTINKIKEIHSINPNTRITIAIDGIGKKHDYIRGVEGAYGKATDLLKNLKAANVRNTRVGFTASDLNSNQIIDVYNLAHNHGAEFSITAVYNSGIRYETVENEISNLSLFKSNLNKLIVVELNRPDPRGWLRAYYAYGLQKYVETGKRILPKSEAAYSIFIHSDGRVILDIVAGHNIGNLQNCNDLNELFKEEIPKAVTEARELPVPWIPCNVRPAMKRHPFKVLFWIFISKWKLLLRGVV